MLPSNASRPSLRDDQLAYRDLIAHLGQFFPEETLAGQLNIEQMFILVDGVLPIEACLYYQVLPLFLDGSRLHLGMVNPLDTTASDYVRRIVSYLHYTLVTRPISTQALQAALSAYLKYSDNQSKTATQADTLARQSAATPALPTPRSQERIHNLDTDNQATFVLEDPDRGDPLPPSSRASMPEFPATDFQAGRGNGPPPTDNQETTILDFEDTNNGPRAQSQADDLLPEANNLREAAEVPEKQQNPDNDEANQEPHPTNSAWGPEEPTTQIQVSPEDMIPQKNINPLPNSLSLEPEEKPNLGANLNSNLGTTLDNSLPNATDDHDPLSVEMVANHGDEDINHLKNLPPRDLLRELMARAMGGGIGRLYFERKQHYGRILWSQSGVLQSAVDDIPPVTFQSLINEFKRLTRLPLLPLQKAKQVELERFYHHNRVLLRFRFIPGKYGEQATLQVLRGSALEFYQQQQVARIGQDAMDIAKELQSKIEELRSRIQSYPKVPISDNVSLAELQQMLLKLKEQVDYLQEKSDLSPDEPAS